MTRLLSKDDVLALLDPDAVIEAVSGAFGAYSRGATDTPLRASVNVPGKRSVSKTGATRAAAPGVILAMPCAIHDPAITGTKVVSVFPGNPARGLPTVASVYLLTDPGTGMPLAVMDGTALTAARTAAGSAVATRHLARPDAHTLGIFGTGVQARAHVEMISRVRTVSRVFVSGRTIDKAEAFAKWVTARFGLEATATAPDITAAADIIACCTTSSVPVIENARPGAHVNAVGAFTPETRELGTDLISRADVYLDTRTGALAEAGDLLIPMDEGRFHPDRVVGEIGDVINGSAPGRARLPEGAVTVYKSVGAAFLDAATARLILDRAEATGTGSTFAFL